MQHSGAWETNNSWDRQETSHNFGTECSLPHSQQPAVLSQTSWFPLIQFNIILTPTPQSAKWSLSLSCPHQNPPSTRHPFVLYAPPTYFPFAHPINICCTIYSHMTTAVPADELCYVTHCYHYTPQDYPKQQYCITAVKLHSYPIRLGKYKNNLFHNSRLESSKFMYNKIERSVLPLLVLLVLLLPTPPPPPPPPTPIPQPPGPPSLPPTQ